MINVTCAIIVYNNKILITQRGEDSDHPFLWEFPGGKVNPGETIRECIVREIREELDIEVEILEKLVSVEFDYGFKKIKLFPFLCSTANHGLKLNEHYDFKWIELTDFENIDFSEADKKLIQQKKNNKILKKYFRENMYNPR